MTHIPAPTWLLEDKEGFEQAMAQKAALILEAKAAWREAEEAHQRALSLALYKQQAARAALNGGVRAADLAAALGVSRERAYRVARGNRSAKDARMAGELL